MLLHGLSKTELLQLKLGNGGGDSVRHFQFVKGAPNETYGIRWPR